MFLLLHLDRVELSDVAQELACVVGSDHGITP